MLTTGGLVPPTLRTPESRPVAPWRVPRVGLGLVLLAAIGMGLALLGQAMPEPAASSPAPVEPAAPAASEPPIGSIPILGDPVRDLTIWYSDRVRDANRAALDNLRGQLLTPVDPLDDSVVQTLYGPMVLITIPILTFGGIVLGYLIMVSGTTGHTAYEARSVAPRYVVGATLAILGHLPRLGDHAVRRGARRGDGGRGAAHVRGRRTGGLAIDRRRVHRPPERRLRPAGAAGP